MFLAASSTPPGRPGTFTPALQAFIADSIRELGWSDTMAGARFGVSSSTLSRWKQQHEEFALALTAARAEFLSDCHQKILEAKTRDGRPDLRALIYLLERAEKLQLRSQHEAELQEFRSTFTSLSEPASRNSQDSPTEAPAPTPSATTDPAPAPEPNDFIEEPFSFDEDKFLAEAVSRDPSPYSQTLLSPTTRSTSFPRAKTLPPPHIA